MVTSHSDQATGPDEHTSFQVPTREDVSSLENPPLTSHPNLRELRLFLRRENQELHAEALPFTHINELFSTHCMPVMRRDVGKGPAARAVVLSREDLDLLGCFAFVTPSGAIESINSEMVQGNNLVLFPEDFGTMDDAMANKDFLRLFPYGLGVVE